MENRFKRGGFLIIIQDFIQSIIISAKITQHTKNTSQFQFLFLILKVHPT